MHDKMIITNVVKILINLYTYGFIIIVQLCIVIVVICRKM